MRKLWLVLLLLIPMNCWNHGKKKKQSKPTEGGKPQSDVNWAKKGTPTKKGKKKKKGEPDEDMFGKPGW